MPEQRPLGDNRQLGPAPGSVGPPARRDGQVAAWATPGFEEALHRSARALQRAWDEELAAALPGVRPLDGVAGVGSTRRDVREGLFTLLQQVGRWAGMHAAMAGPSDLALLRGVGLTRVVVPLHVGRLLLGFEVIDLPFWLIAVGSDAGGYVPRGLPPEFSPRSLPPPVGAGPVFPEAPEASRRPLERTSMEADEDSSSTTHHVYDEDGRKVELQFDGDSTGDASTGLTKNKVSLKLKITFGNNRSDDGKSKDDADGKPEGLIWMPWFIGTELDSPAFTFSDSVFISLLQRLGVTWPPGAYRWW